MGAMTPLRIADLFADANRSAAELIYWESAGPNWWEASQREFRKDWHNDPVTERWWPVPRELGELGEVPKDGSVQIIWRT